jgi:hypothetical protein
VDPVVIVFAVLAVVVIASFIVFRQRSNVKIKGPFGVEASIEGSNDPPPPTPPPTPGIKIGTAVSHGGSTVTEDHTGRGITADKLEAQGDVRTTLTQTENTPDPKA